MSDDQAYLERWHSQKSLFNHFKGCLNKFKDIDSAKITGLQLRGRGENSPTLFQNRKNCLDFEKKEPDCAHLWVKLSIQNIVLRVSRRKNSKMFP